jgi:plastocyanin
VKVRSWAHPVFVIVALLAAAALVAACSDGDSAEDDAGGAGSEATTPSATDGGEGTSVRAVEGTGDPRDAWTFEPSAITVVAGTEIVFTNDGDEVHTATADDGSFDTGTLNTGDSHAVVFDEAGSFAFHCSLHPWMSGQIVVTPVT